MFLSHSKFQRLFRTRTHTFSTTDTFRRIRCLYRIHIHRADMRTFTTMYTFSHIHIHMKKADFIQKSIDCSQRTHHFAEKPADTQTSHQCDHQDYHFHGNNVPITRRSSGCVERSGIPPSSVATGQISSQNTGTPQDTGIFPLIGINQLLSNA